MMKFQWSNILLGLLICCAFQLPAQNVRKEKRILIFTKNVPWAYRHESITAGTIAIKKACESIGMKVDTSENADLFTDESLKKYSSLVFLSANQDIFNADQEAALQRYVRAGGGVAGIHSATGVERNWKWFAQMLGGVFQWHTEQQEAFVVVKDPNHPATKGLPKRWKRWDEWYFFKDLSPNIKVLTTLDTTTFKSKLHTQNYPSSWCQEFEGGRSFYTALGHNAKDYSDPVFLKHILGGITYTIGQNYELDYSKVKKYEVPKARLITLDPGHFHAALVQKSMYDNIDPNVQVYAPASQDVEDHLKRIDAYNTRAVQPTRWNEVVYRGNDFLEKMLAEKKGNMVVLAGNNRKKTEYIKKSLEAGMNVLADKPMCIDTKGYEMLKEAFAVAKKNNVLLYDIMTERSEITTVLQKELSQVTEIFGKLEKGTPENPAVIKESVHHFYKSVSGSPLKRPVWFMDVTQEGEGIVDVTTHLVDLVQWECFPEIPLNNNDVKINHAKRWVTPMTLSQFSKITGASAFPSFLKKDVVNDTVLNVFCNGEINYALKGVNAKVKVIWNYSAPEGGDTHYSIMKGSMANLEIRQGAAEKYVPQLYIKPGAGLSETSLNSAFEKVKAKYAGISLKKQGEEWLVEIPDKYRNGHEAHFAEVMERFLKFYNVNNLPDWELSNMLVKYYTTTQALDLAKEAK
ncbi:Type 1 glutamine amidotransferase (GATase1) [Pseudarcicella hirudinis]|uniref:Type 1 glutamine amidotransferase (GATase1) n=1 Tax=Pseudarcicella hirudinis TaxID=1079859 RepID=A0A1I5TX48_9BACT|nr:putative oxidoreductase C-terminal domain-containing protein [Pseudarcicella hirudinis]SFP87652.1 Type 1 glutamine amidotransferase (GATase1) [Pseudarcicella hirudinis]